MAMKLKDGCQFSGQKYASDIEFCDFTPKKPPLLGQLTTFPGEVP
jgi:hypothetical protein